jgi:hypothetical protein
MAGGVRLRTGNGGEQEEVFDRRSRSIKDWQDLVARRSKRHRVSLDEFTKRNVIRLGVETDCPHCQAINWHGLSSVDYEVPCERCLKSYPFPQAKLRTRNRNWAYRVIGPFSVPDYARGAYSTLLALAVMEHFGPGHQHMTCATGLTLKLEDCEIEADFVTWHAEQSFGQVLPPRLVIGETKSFGAGELIKPKDIQRLRTLATRLPGTAIVFAVMRDHFTPKETALLLSFVRWCRRPDADGRPSNPVILLTGHELFFDFSLGHTWKQLGGKHCQFSDYRHTRHIEAFADSTQSIYLGLPSFESERWEKLRAKAATQKRNGPAGNAPSPSSRSSRRMKTHP